MRSPQKRILLILASAIVLAGNVDVLQGSQASRHTYVVRYKHGNTLIPVTVVLDYKRQTEYVINMNSRSPAKSVTLYDFKEKVIAYKDLKNGECFIGRLTHETMQQENDVLQRLKSPVESKPLILTLELSRPTLTPTEVRNLAGHKTAVFCRRMNTWTLKSEKENNRRKKREVRRQVLHRETDYHHRRTDDALHRSQGLQRGHDSIHRKRSYQDLKELTSNGSFSATYQAAEHSKPPSLHEARIPESTRLGSVYPLIVPRQKISTTRHGERRELKLSEDIYNTSRKIIEDNIQRFGFPQRAPAAHGRFEANPSSANITSFLPSAVNSFPALKADHPVIIPSVGFHNQFPDSKFANVYSSKPVGIIGAYSPGSGSFQTLHHRGEAVEDFPAFHQLPPESFVLPLTRSSSSSTATPKSDSRLGYEIVTSEGNRTYNHSVPIGDQNRTVAVPGDRTRQLPLPTLGATELHTSAGADIYSPEITSGSVDQPFGKENASAILFSNQVQTEAGNGQSSVRGLLKPKPPSTERGDIPAEVPQWYSEITKQISIPLEIEVIHHREEYIPSVGNVTEGVVTPTGREFEDRPRYSNVSTSDPAEFVTESNSVTSDPGVKLLPQVGNAPHTEDAKEPLEERRRKLQPVEVGFPIYRGENTVAQREDFSDFRQTPHRNSTPGLTPIRSQDVDAETVSGIRQDVIHNFVRPAPPRRAQGGGRTPKRQQHFNHETFNVQDLNINEGIPTYRKRFPSVTQLFPPDETVTGVGRSPNRRFRINQQVPPQRRRFSAVRNSTRGVHESRKHLLGQNDLVNRQQAGISNQGITFHHRGPGRVGVPVPPYGRSGFGPFPPGVSVHPRHPQAPYAELAGGVVKDPVPINPLQHSRGRRIHLRHHRRHQRKRNRILPPEEEMIPPSSSCCGKDDRTCCPARKRGRHFPKTACCPRQRDERRPNSVLPPRPPPENEVQTNKRVEGAEDDRCMREKMCRTVYQSAKKVLVCRNVDVDGC